MIIMSFCFDQIYFMSLCLERRKKRLLEQVKKPSWVFCLMVPSQHCNGPYRCFIKRVLSSSLSGKNIICSPKSLTTIDGISIVIVSSLQLYMVWYKLIFYYTFSRECIFFLGSLMIKLLLKVERGSSSGLAPPSDLQN